MDKARPIFQSIFGEQWHRLPPVMHRHYANRPYCQDVVVSKGMMNIEIGLIPRLLTPLLRLFGALVPYEGKEIPVTVNFRSEPDSHAFCLDRIFYLPGMQPYHFFSKLVHIKDDHVIEFMRFGLGWRHRFEFRDGKVVLLHAGYVWKLFGIIIPIPLSLFIGHGYAEEQAVSETSFRMKMTITHPFFGKMYEYNGDFEIFDE